MSKKKKAQATKVDAPKRHGPVPLEVRKRIVQAVMRGATHADAAIVFGVSTAVVQKFMGLFRSGGLEALHPRLGAVAASEGEADGATEKPKRRRRQSAKGSPEREGVIALRKANPDWGARRLSDVLARFQGLGVSDSTVLRVLHEEGLIEEQEPYTPREKPERRFERAEPNQLWQSDIFTFELRRNQRVYVAAFLDDHSRYLVSWAIAHHQKSPLVLEAIERGIAEYGEPREVLTDQGRQYTAWRGSTDFEHLLRRHGIAHVKSRPQHPQTLGKIERFWKSLWCEFLSKTVFADFADCERRIALYVQHYNFQRPHQGIDGLVPADRFFRAAAHVRAAVEAQVAANALRLAQEKPPHKPFYLVGRLGDQDLSIAAAGGALRVQVGDAAQTIPIRQEEDHEPQASRIFVTTEDTNDENPASTSSSPGAAMADGTRGSRPGSTATMPAGVVGAVRREAGNAGDLRARNLAPAVLPARGEGAGRHADRASTGGERDELAERRDAGTPGRATGEPDRGARAGQAAPGAPAVSDEEGVATGAGDSTGEAGPSAPRLVGRWSRTLEWLERDDAGDDDFDGEDLDPDLGWRDEALNWHRKLAGADASVDRDRGGDHDQATWRQRAVDVSREPDDTQRAEATVRSVEGSARQPDDDQRGSARGRDRASEHAELGASHRSGGPLGDHAQTDGARAEIEHREGADGANEGARAPEREADGAAPGGGRHDGGGGRDHSEPAGTAADAEEFRFPLTRDDDAFAAFWTEVAEGIAKLDAEKLAADILEFEQSRDRGSRPRSGSAWRGVDIVTSIDGELDDDE